jgi:hypothetical protein
MIEPPSQTRIRRVFEIDDGVHIAIKQTIFEKLRCPVGKSSEFEGRAGGVLVLEEPAKERG